MAMISCPECKKKISDSASSCPNCGYQLTAEKIAEIKKKEQQAKKDSGIGCLTVTAIISVLLLVGFFSSLNSPSSNRSSTSTVENSEWDGSVSQVKLWLKENLKDPGSLEFIEWSHVSKTNDGGFMVRVKYRAKNSLGGYAVENKIFFLNSAGTVTKSMDY